MSRDLAILEINVVGFILLYIFLYLTLYLTFFLVPHLPHFEVQSQVFGSKFFLLSLSSLERIPASESQPEDRPAFTGL